ncbi:uncharacterized protein LOC117300121 [Asterias rubens]|uniref:uncharacterized protein LOC117300121 n=1 Tax=Asterias rubens TaxID=7604 RepID=UPI00145524F5|nr:uncharacterized protein LOC117300121 [Asterias rubens]
MRSGPGLLTILRIATAEWVSLRSNMINNQGNFGANVRETLQHLHSSKIYPNLAKIASATLVIPVSTADCERGFSKLKRTKTRPIMSQLANQQQLDNDGGRRAPTREHVRSGQPSEIRKSF